MHQKFAAYFVDPHTKEPLTLEIKVSRGDIIESGCFKSLQREYPIVKGIPRFVGHTETNYASSFGYEWRKWARVQFDSQNVGKPMEGYTQKMWERITGLQQSLEGQVVVDIGCGAGRFIETARQKGAQVIGLDYSDAVEVAAENFKDDENVCICQADALHLPIKEQSVEGAFSIGVLHHTPKPSQGIIEATQTLKTGGWLAAAVYGKGGYYDFPTVQLWRKFFQKIQPILKYYPPLIYTYLTVYGFYPIRSIPILNKAVRVVFPFVSLPDIQWSLLDTFDSISPAYQSAHTSYEVFQWFKNAGLSQIEPGDWGFTAYHGVKM